MSFTKHDNPAARQDAVAAAVRDLDRRTSFLEPLQVLRDDGRAEFDRLLPIDPRAGALRVALPALGAGRLRPCAIAEIGGSTNTVTVYAPPGATIEGSSEWISTTAYATALFVPVSTTQWAVF